MQFKRRGLDQAPVLTFTQKPAHVLMLDADWLMGGHETESWALIGQLQHVLRSTHGQCQCQTYNYRDDGVTTLKNSLKQRNLTYSDGKFIHKKILHM